MYYDYLTASGSMIICYLRLWQPFPFVARYFASMFKISPIMLTWIIYVVVVNSLNLFYQYYQFYQYYSDTILLRLNIKSLHSKSRWKSVIKRNFFLINKVYYIQNYTRSFLKFSEYYPNLTKKRCLTGV